MNIYKQISNSSVFKILLNNVNCKNIATCYHFLTNDKDYAIKIINLFISYIENNEKYLEKVEEISKFKNPDINFITNTSVFQINEILSKLELYPLQFKYKYIIFTDICLLTERVQNLLLKSLEEAPSFVIFLFIGNYGKEKILNTINSRMRNIYVEKLNLIDIDNYLKEINLIKYSKLSTYLCNFELSAAIEFDETKEKIFLFVLDMLTKLYNELQIINYIVEFNKEKIDLNFFIDMLFIVFQYIIEYKIYNKCTLVQYEENFKKISCVYSLKNIYNLIPILLNVKSNFLNYGNMNACIDALFFSLFKERYVFDNRSQV